MKAARARAAAAGKVRLTLRLTAAGKRLLTKRRNARLTLPVKITFTPDGGKAASRVRR